MDRDFGSSPGCAISFSTGEKKPDDGEFCSESPAYGVAAGRWETGGGATGARLTGAGAIGGRFIGGGATGWRLVAWGNAGPRFAGGWSIG
ncbi:hypothetical protein [Winogradskya consettensis]|uniref:hypothetical protein n=1 Tax=Winogradskya consettensis TaxID=113560 RepID=UPI001BB3442B|nr:hypothetical protein [Actinoplanes consettensis]